MPYAADEAHLAFTLSRILVGCTWLVRRIRCKPLDSLQVCETSSCRLREIYRYFRRNADADCPACFRNAR